MQQTNESLRFETLETNQHARHSVLKRQLLEILQLLDEDDLNLSSVDIQHLANDILAKDRATFKKSLYDVLNEYNKTRGILAVIRNMTARGVAAHTDTQTRLYPAALYIASQDDPSFSEMLEKLADQHMEFRATINELKQEIARLLQERIREHSQRLLGTLERSLRDKINDEV